MLSAPPAAVAPTTPPTPPTATETPLLEHSTQATPQRRRYQSSMIRSQHDSPTAFIVPHLPSANLGASHSDDRDTGSEMKAEISTFGPPVINVKQLSYSIGTASNVM